MEKKVEKQEAAEIVLPKGRIAAWLENFWYHYKWPTLIAAFFVFVFVVCFVQCSTNERGDLTVGYAVGWTMTSEERAALIGAMEAMMPNEDGKEPLSLSIADYPVYSEEELQKKFTDEEGNFSLTAYESMRQQSNRNMQTFGNYVMTGDCALYLMRESVYRAQNMTALAAPLEDIYGADAIPASAYDAYAIRLGDTAFYQYYAAIRFLPEDTLLVLSKPYVFGNISDEEIYGEFEQLFRAIVEFQAP